MKTEILRILKSTEGYISGQEICNRLGVSRTAVWKVMNQLKQEGYEIEAVSNKGYHILQCPDIVTEQELESVMQTKSIGRRVRFYEELDSTNTEAKRLAEEADTDGLLVITERQNAGKGRRGRTWESPRGSGIWMTVIIKPQMSPVHASGLTLAAALAVAKGIRSTTGLPALIKWPNDIVVHGKKICGILTEMSSEPDCINHIVIGIGINVNMESFPSEISATATSLFIEKKQKIRRSELIAAIMEEFEVQYAAYLQTSDMSLLLPEYNALLVNINKEVKVLEGSTDYTGIALGVNNRGELLVKTEDTLKQVVAGEVSVRGIYGYV